MPGKQTSRGNQPIEFVEEPSLAQEVQDPNMQWFGMMNMAEVTHDLPINQIEDYVGRMASSLESYVNVEEEEYISITLRGAPQNLDIIDYFAGGTGYTTDTIIPIQIGERNEETGEYRRLLGCVGEKLTFTFEQDSVAEVVAQFRVCEATPWTNTDYIGSGSHAEVTPSEPFTFDDLSNVRYGGVEITDAIQRLEITMQNELLVHTDVNSSLSTDISAIRWDRRKISCTLDVTYSDMGLIERARQRDEQDLNFRVAGGEFSIGNVMLEQAPRYTETGEVQTATYSTTPATKSTSFSWGHALVPVEPTVVESTAKVTPPPPYPPEIEPTEATATPTLAGVHITVGSSKPTVVGSPSEGSAYTTYGLGDGALGNVPLGNSTDEQL